MNRFIWSQFRFRRSRTATLSFAILVAAVSFTLLTSAASTSALRVRGTVTQNFETAYDILVRPTDSFTTLERERGLVTANYLSGIFGGIRLDQYEEIGKIPGVAIAAPIANLGYVITPTDIDIPLDRFLNKKPVQLYRVQAMWRAHEGLSSYQGQTFYVYRTNHRMTWDEQHSFREWIPGREKPAYPCSGLNKTYSPTSSPFARGGRREAGIDCFSGRSPQARPPADWNPIYTGKGVGSGTQAQFPFLLAAIDPEQEDRLVGLEDAVVSGRYLKEDDDVRFDPVCIVCGPAIPVIAGGGTYVDEFLEFEVERLEIPSVVDVPSVLGSAEARNFLSGLSGRVVDQRTFSPDEMYVALLDSLSRGLNFPFSQFWTLSPIRYEAQGQDRLRATTTRNPKSVWKSAEQESGYFLAPPGSEDVQFRRLRVYQSMPNPQGATSAGLRVLGRYEPEKLPGFSPLTEVPLESYYPPAAEPANVASRRALGGGALLPSMNLGDYMTQPPFMFTNLRAAQRLLETFEGSNAGAPISVIRVRVKGVSGPDRLSQERIRRVAEAIQKRTGLAVDVTAGSSPRPLLIELPAGAYGRPPLLVREGWVQKGVVVAIVSAVDRKSVALFFLVLVVCGLFLANGALAAVRSRRREIGTLMCLGWSRGRIFVAVVGELAIVGLVAGLGGAVLAGILVSALSLEMSVLRALLVIPIGVLLAVAAGVIPAWRAARGEPLDAVVPPVSRYRTLRSVRTMGLLALANLMRLPGRTALAASGLFIGVGALALLLAINSAFHTSLVGTLLGNVISIQVRGVDYLSVILAILLGGLSVADVLFLNLKERAPEIVTLRASGWHDHHIRRVVTLEGLGLGLLGSLPGAAAGLTVGILIGGPPMALAVATSSAAIGGVLIAVIASIAPAALSSRMTLPAVLAEE